MPFFTTTQPSPPAFADTSVVGEWLRLSLMLLLLLLARTAGAPVRPPLGTLKAADAARSLWVKADSSRLSAYHTGLILSRPTAQ